MVEVGHEFVHVEFVGTPLPRELDLETGMRDLFFIDYLKILSVEKLVQAPALRRREQHLQPNLRIAPAFVAIFCVLGCVDDCPRQLGVRQVPFDLCSDASLGKNCAPADEHLPLPDWQALPRQPRRICRPSLADRECHPHQVAAL